MHAILSALLVAAQPSAAAECIHDAVPVDVRAEIGAAVLAKRSKALAADKAFMAATNACARRNAWSAEQTVHANGYAAMRFAADTIAGRLGHASWSGLALQLIRERPRDQISDLAATGAGGAEFELVLGGMIGVDGSIPATLESQSKEGLESFVLMIKLLALGETERWKV